MENIAEVDPKKEIVFSVRDAGSATSEIRIKNTCDSNIGFKIKTTQPTLYFVKPNTGILPPTKEIIVSINLNQIPGSLKDHKFMLQIARTSIQSEGVTPEILNQFWKDFKQLEKDQKEEYKLKVSLKSSEFPDPSVEEIKVGRPSAKESKGPSVGSTKGADNQVKENVIYVNEEVLDSPEAKKSLYKEALADDNTSLYVSNQFSNNDETNQWREKIKKLEKTYESMKAEIQQKEKELRDLREKESEEDAKAYKNNRVGGPGFRKQLGNNKTDAEFTILHLIAAIIGGLIIGMLFSKLIF